MYDKSGIAVNLPGFPGSPVFHILRLEPEDDLRNCVWTFAQERAISAAALVTCVGSLSHACLRFSGQEQGTELIGPFEILAMVGTLSYHGLHLHLTVGDQAGQVRGGHLMPGCRIYTTAEIAIAVLPDLLFQRCPDARTGYRELEILPASGAS
ncbi:PPC domain-containing DNA-binding protein [Leptolyngbya sp. PCC 6406]|uniref:PPC domain-containing DNA-binding protein n=1 Tax=Leptolyngbya sp. PCC 6406 TaxID=1173264 RepID=UPI0002F4E9CA|nr:PPC domain-containing DNA-binding protein [Leptolyngbya sp. PCC 6406]